jgi:hypothetical protein
MLAHLVSLPLRSEKMFAACLLVFLAGSAGKTLAADLTPVGGLDAAATGNVSSAKTDGDGQIRTSIAVSGSETVADEKMLGGETAGKYLLRDAHRASVLMGTAINRATELTLGLHGTYEHVRPEDRDQLFPESTGDNNPVTSEEDDEQNWRRDFKQTAFSGVSLMLKLKLLDAGSTQISIAPFVESGAGETASYSLTRSVGPKAGYIAMFSYGARGVASLDLNAGYRYRNPEETGALTVRNEVFYKGLGKAYIGRDFALFLGAEGRKLMVAKNSERDSESGALTYKGSEAGEIKGGFQLAAGDFDISASYGQRLKESTGFGYGQSSFTAGLSMALTNYKRARPSTSYASEIDSRKNKELTEKDKAELKKDDKNSTTVPAAANQDDYSEMIGSDIDPLESLGKEDGEDFRDMDTRIKQYDSDSKVESEDAKIERELREIRAAEEMATTEREKEAAVAAEKNRLDRVRKSKEDEALRQEWLQEAEQDSEKVQGITDQEMNWNGLE